jgi:hypothetical protein
LANSSNWILYFLNLSGFTGSGYNKKAAEFFRKRQ